MLDTETTGLNVDQGDRLIEIGVVEYDGMSATGRTYHTYVNPGDRQVQAGAIAVHGITNEMLKDAPAFADIADDFLDFIGDHPLVNQVAARTRLDAPVEFLIVDPVAYESFVDAPPLRCDERVYGDGYTAGEAQEHGSRQQGFPFHNLCPPPL